MTIFHERLRILYEDARDKDHTIGRQKFAELCGVTKTLIDNYLNGVGWPTLENFCKICKGLKANPAWMIGQSNVKYSYESRFAELADELSEAQMEAVEAYVRFLKYVEKEREGKDLPNNIDLPR